MQKILTLIYVYHMCSTFILNLKIELLMDYTMIAVVMHDCTHVKKDNWKQQPMRRIG